MAASGLPALAPYSTGYAQRARNHSNLRYINIYINISNL